MATENPNRTTEPDDATAREPRLPSSATEPQSPEPAAAGPAPASAERAPWRPRLFSVLLGLVCLAVAGFALATELGGVTLDWSAGGPFVLIGVGVVTVVLGLVGLVTSRRT